ncbi:MAG: sulfotransferase [Chloroflexota bacterium]
MSELPLGEESFAGRVRHLVRGTPLHTGWRYAISTRDARRHRDELRSVGTFVTFLGHARSGHSIVGALLDAHPQIVLSDELDALKYVAAGFDRDRVLALCLKVARDQHRRERRKRGRGGSVYSYAVPGQWQGRHRELRVVGDSDAGRSVQRLDADPAFLDRLRRTMAGLDLRFIHVVRNPYDNIGTMMLRSGRTFESGLERYFGNWEKIERLRERLEPDAIHTLRHEDLVTRPREELAVLCTLLGLPAPEDYLQAAAGILFRGPSRTRDQVDWSAEQRTAIEAGIARHAGLAGYSFDA